jgi:phospholipase C
MAKADIKHVVTLMLENRSFDHMLGLMPNSGFEGLLKPGTTTIDPQYTNALSSGPKGHFPAVGGAPYAIDRHLIDNKGFGGPSHTYPGATWQLYGSETPAALADPAPLGGFVDSYYRSLTTDVHLKNPTTQDIEVPMQAFGPGQLPVLWQLAREFAVCDHWFSEVPGPTQPNRLFVHAATSLGFTHNVWSHPIQAPTVYEELEKVGRSWAFYYFDLTDSDSFPQLKKRVEHIQKFDAFYEAAHAGALPTYSFLCPRYNDKQGQPPPNSQHAPYDVRNGETLIADVYEALRNGPLWSNTLLIVTYDEHGGFYDHVSPPAKNVNAPDKNVSPTDFDKAEAQRDPKNNDYLLTPKYKFDFKRLGLRVPTILISPWVKRGDVIKDQLQHTSILATLRDLFGTGVLTDRDRQAKSFTAAFLDAARDDAPARLNRPPAPAPTTGEDMQKPLTEQQTDMWPMLANLDGHKDSGKVTKPPKTRGEAQHYIQERRAAHDAFHRHRRHSASYKISKDPAGHYQWQLHGEHHQVIAVSPHTYKTHAEAEAHIDHIRDVASQARQVSA